VQNLAAINYTSEARRAKPTNRPRMGNSSGRFLRIRFGMDETGAIPISRRQSDPLRAFCDELNSPLEEVFNLIYLATHVSEGPHSEAYLQKALERLAKVRHIVMLHCQDTQERKWAS